MAFPAPSIALPSAPESRFTRRGPRDPSPGPSTAPPTPKGYIVVHSYTPHKAVVHTSDVLIVNLSYFDGFSKEAALVELRLCARGCYIPAFVAQGAKLTTLKMTAALPVDMLDGSLKPIPLSVHAFRENQLVDFCDFGCINILSKDPKLAPEPLIVEPAPPHASNNAPTLRTSRKRAHSESGSEFSDIFNDDSGSDDEYVQPDSPIKTRSKRAKNPEQESTAKIETSTSVADPPDTIPEAFRKVKPLWTGRRSPVHETKMNKGFWGHPVLLLHIEGDLDSVTHHAAWSYEELQSGRKLVAFYRRQIGRTIRLTFTCVARAEDAGPGSLVISCLLPPRSANFYISSVDFVRFTAYLLDPRPQSKMLAIDEKNRVRRTLEPYGPLTAKRSDPATSHIFEWIIALPAPRPVTIAKETKLFEWGILEAGLAKLLAKYAYDVNDDTLTEYGLPKPVPRQAFSTYGDNLHVLQPEIQVQPPPKAKGHSRRPSLNRLNLQLPPLKDVLPEVMISGPEPSSAGSSLVSPSPFGAAELSPTDSNYSATTAQTTAPSTPIDESFFPSTSVNTKPKPKRAPSRSPRKFHGSSYAKHPPAIHLDQSAHPDGVKYEVDELSSLSPLSPFGNFDLTLDPSLSPAHSSNQASGSQTNQHLLAPNGDWSQLTHVDFDANGNLIMAGSPAPLMRAPPTTPLDGLFALPGGEAVVSTEAISAQQLDTVLNDIFSDVDFSGWDFTSPLTGGGGGEPSMGLGLDVGGGSGYDSAAGTQSLDPFDAAVAALDALSSSAASVTAEWAEAGLVKGIGMATEVGRDPRVGGSNGAAYEMDGQGAQRRM